MLFNIVPQLFDIVAACIFISAALEAWIAVIVFITLGSYIPVTIFLTEWRVKHRQVPLPFILPLLVRMSSHQASTTLVTSMWIARQCMHGPYNPKAAYKAAQAGHGL